MDTEPYFKRIGYRGSPNPTLATLRHLHRQHLLTVPFENLDIFLGKPIILDSRAFYQKIVENGRGGYCYELNGCFAWLLKEMGFEVSLLSARVAISTRSYTPQFDHMALLIQLKERWLADVGFGDCFTEPKKIDESEPQTDSGYEYRLTGDQDERLLSRRENGSPSWNRQYLLSLRPRTLFDFETRNSFQQTSPRSHFTQGRLISMATESGRVTLTDKKLILSKKGRRTEKPISGEEEFGWLLSKYFRLKLLPKRVNQLRLSAGGTVPSGLHS